VVIEELNAREIARLVREYAEPDLGLGWVGNSQMVENAEEIAAHIVENYNPKAPR